MRLWLSRASRGGFYDARIRRLAAYRGACGGRFLCANESGREGKTGKRQASGHPLRAVLPLHAPLFISAVPVFKQLHEFLGAYMLPRDSELLLDRFDHRISPVPGMVWLIHDFADAKRRSIGNAESDLIGL